MKSRGYTCDVNMINATITPHDFYLREQNLSHFGHRSGQWAISGLCPFHEDTRLGSFKVNLTTGGFRCWSCGAYGGDIIAFIQKRDDLGFKDALQKLSSEWELPC